MEDPADVEASDDGELDPDEQFSPMITHPMLSSDLTARWELITPELAQTYLDTLPEYQRPRSGGKVSEHTAEMKKRQWWLTGDTIRFDNRGRLADGQHRLTACVQADQAFFSLVVRGLDDKAFPVMDTNLTRSFAFVLGNRFNSPNPPHEAALTTMIWHWQRHNFGYAHVPWDEYPEHAHTKPPRGELIEIYMRYRDDIVSAVKASTGLVGKMPKVSIRGPRGRKPAPAVSRGTLAFLWLLLRRIDMDRAERFFFLLKDEEFRLSAPEESRAFRQLLRTLNSKADEVRGKNSWIALAFCLRTWNTWLRSEPIGDYWMIPSPPLHKTLPLPIDPNDVMREPGWEPL